MNCYNDNCTLLHIVIIILYGLSAYPCCGSSDGQCLYDQVIETGVVAALCPCPWFALDFCCVSAVGRCQAHQTPFRIRHGSVLARQLLSGNAVSAQDRPGQQIHHFHLLFRPREARASRRSTRNH
ncbi:hypothetical protein B0H10DRAFT_345335 [Mycena sp. CBHHK59/15]|nr:hypothetical protein B0H10DRAFT_345335 [Mycena sp. CBHHK59/15]